MAVKATPIAIRFTPAQSEDKVRKGWGHRAKYVPAPDPGGEAAAKFIQQLRGMGVPCTNPLQVAGYSTITAYPNTEHAQNLTYHLASLMRNAVVCD